MSIKEVYTYGLFAFFHPFTLKFAALLEYFDSRAYICSPFSGELYKITIHMNPLLKIVSDEYNAKRQTIPAFSAGDTVNVHVKIKEGNKERVQQFQGVVLQKRNVGSQGETFTVRKTSGGIGVERIFPVLSDNVDKIELVRKGSVKRARLFYLRD